MSIYEAGASSYYGKFLRVGNVIHVADQRDWNHEFLALKDGITEQIGGFKATSPEEVDGGFVDIKDSVIGVSGFSSHFKIPVQGDMALTMRVRQRTVDLFRAQSPGYDVVDEGIV
jgi:hypothetical protein